MAESIDLGADAQDWDVLLKTWYEGAYGDGHAWLLYHTPWEEPTRFAARYLALAWNARDGKWPGERLDAEPKGRQGRTVLLDPERVRALLSEGAAPVPLVGYEDVHGLDGWRRGYSAGDFSSEVRLSWWCEGPEEWRPFTLWIESLQRYLHRELFPDEPDVPPVIRP